MHESGPTTPGSRPIGRGGRAGGTVAGAAAVVAIATAASRLTGFAREAVMAAVYGASADVDAYLVALGIPNVAIGLLSTAIVTAAIPAIASRLREADVAAAHRLFRTLAVGVLATLMTASAAMAFAAPTLVRLMAPGFDRDASALAAELTTILLLATVLVAAMNLASGLLQVHRRFFWPAFVGIPFNLVMITVMLTLGARYGVAALAWGFVFGSLCRLLVQLPAVRRVGFRWWGPVSRRDEGVRAVATLVPVVVLGHVTSNVNSFIDRIVGSVGDPGTISALNYAYRLVTLPHGLLVMALIQVLYPAFGSLREVEDRSAFAALSTRGMTVLSCILVPLAAVTVLLAEPIVQVAYGRGNFGAGDVSRTATALIAYAPGLVALGVRDLSLRALYGLQDAKLPALVAVVGMLVNVVGDVTLGLRFGVAGLGAATSVSFLASAFLAVAILARRHDGVRIGSLLSCLRRNAEALVASCVAVLAVRWAFGDTSSAAAAAGLVVLGGGAGAATHLLALRLLGAPEVAELRKLVAILRRRLHRP